MEGCLVYTWERCVCVRMDTHIAVGGDGFPPGGDQPAPAGGNRVGRMALPGLRSPPAGRALQPTSPLSRDRLAGLSIWFVCVGWVHTSHTGIIGTDREAVTWSSAWLLMTESPHLLLRLLE